LKTLEWRTFSFFLLNPKISKDGLAGLLIFCLNFFKNLETWKQKAESRKRELEEDRRRKNHPDEGEQQTEQTDKKEEEEGNGEDGAGEEVKTKETQS
jgi:hypothetical protein